MRFKIVLVALLAFAFLPVTCVVAVEAAPVLSIPEGAQAGPGFDVDRATEAWVGTLSPEQPSVPTCLRHRPPSSLV